MEPFLQVHEEVLRYLEKLHETQEMYHTQYKEYIEKNRQTKVFGLDSFYFQSRLYDLETKQLHEQYSFINNRIYCDYYKLYAMVKVFYKESFKLEPKKRTFPPYKDLEVFKQYDIQEAITLNVDIQEMIKKAYAYVEKHEEDIVVQCSNPSLHIENYKYNHHYNNALLKNKMELYEKYLHSYHIYHMSFLCQLRDKIMLLFRQTENRVLMGNSDAWVEERLIKESVQESKNQDLVTPPKIPLEVLNVLNVLEGPLVPKVPEVPLVPVEVPLEVPLVPVEVPLEVPLEIPELPVEVSLLDFTHTIADETHVSLLNSMNESMELTPLVQVLDMIVEVPELPVEVPLELPVEVPVEFPPPPTLERSLTELPPLLLPEDLEDKKQLKKGKNKK